MISRVCGNNHYLESRNSKLTLFSPFNGSSNHSGQDPPPPPPPVFFQGVNSSTWTCAHTQTNTFTHMYLHSKWIGFIRCLYIPGCYLKVQNKHVIYIYIGVTNYSNINNLVGEYMYQYFLILGSINISNCFTNENGIDVKKQWLAISEPSLCSVTWIGV